MLYDSPTVAWKYNEGSLLTVDRFFVVNFRRSPSQCAHLTTESRLEQAREDFTRVAQLDPSNREAREQLQKIKERLKEIKQDEKRRLSEAMQGGLYKEQHAKLGKQQEEYEKEVLYRDANGSLSFLFYKAVTGWSGNRISDMWLCGAMLFDSLVANYLS